MKKIHILASILSSISLCLALPDHESTHRITLRDKETRDRLHKPYTKKIAQKSVFFRSLSKNIQSRIVKDDFTGTLCSMPSNPLNGSNKFLIASKNKGDQMVPVLIDTQEGKEISRFEDNHQFIDFLSTDSAGNILLLGYFGLTPAGCMYDIETGKIISKFGDENSDAAITNVVFSPDQHEIWIVSFDKGVLRYDVKTSKYIGKFERNYAAVSPDSSRGMILNQDGNLELWKIKEDIFVRTINIQNKEIYPIYISPDNTTFTACNGFPTYHKEAYIGSLLDGTYKKIDLPGPASCAAFNPDSSYIAYTINNDTSTGLPIVDIEKNKIIKTLKTSPGGGVGGEPLGTAWNKEYFATCLTDKNGSECIEIWQDPLKKSETELMKDEDLSRIGKCALS